MTEADLLQALGHPTRVHILNQMLDDPSRPLASVDIKEAGPLNSVAYHMRILAKAGVVHVVRQVQRRGALATYYAIVNPDGVRAILRAAQAAIS